MQTMVYLISDGQQKMLEKMPFAPDSYFCPIKDKQDRWVISVEVVKQCVDPRFMWVKTLQMIPYEPKPTPPMLGMEVTSDLP